MIFRALGFDLGGREPALWRGLGLAAAAAFCEALAYAELARVVVVIAAGQASGALALEAVLVVAVAIAGQCLLRGHAMVVSFAATYAMVARMRLHIADHLSRLPMGQMAENRSAVISELLTGRFVQYQDAVTHAWALAVFNALLPAFLWLLMLWLAWPLALVTLVFVALALLAIPWCHRRMARAAGQLAVPHARFVTQLGEAILGARELRQFRGGAERQQQLRDTLRLLEAEQLRHEVAPAPALLAYGFLGQLGFALSIILGTLLLLPQSAAALLAFLPIGLRFWRAMGELGLHLAELRFARHTLARIRALAIEPALPQPARPEEPGLGGLVLEHVSLRAILQDISGAVPEGHLVALVGASGAGKSHLAGLMARLWDPDEGHIRLGDTDLRNLGEVRLNRSIAIVLQDIVLFDLSIADNIRLGCPEASLEQVRAAAKAAGADDFILRLPQGYGTRLHSNGAQLSGGERQRLAIARALLKDASILVLDEATAQLDPQREVEVQRALATLAAQRTVIVIAHRLHSVTTADEIWVLDKGRVAERGTHAALLAQGGVYTALWSAQNTVRDWPILTVRATVE
jgi:ATP-binding cassette subfamily B protein